MTLTLLNTNVPYNAGCSSDHTSWTDDGATTPKKLVIEQCHL